MQVEDGRMRAEDKRMRAEDGRIRAGDGKMRAGDGRMRAGDVIMRAGDGRSACLCDERSKSTCKYCEETLKGACDATVNGTTAGTCDVCAGV